MANKFIGDVDTVESITDEDSLFVNAADKLRKIKKNKVKLDYVNNINNKPRVNGVELSGDKSLDSLGIGSKTALDELSDKLNNCAPAITCEASGESITVEDSSENYFNGLNIYGKSEQVQTNGYQLFDASKFSTKTQGGVTATNNGDGSFTISGSGAITNDFALSYTLTHDETIRLLKAGNITLDCQKTTTPYIEFQLLSQNIVQLRLDNHNSPMATKTITQEMLDRSDLIIRLFLYAYKGDNIKPGTIRPMLYQYGDGTWEPYKNPQTLTIPTPNGLPGIPVETGGNYTDETGQQWICDEVDFARGKYVQRVKKDKIVLKKTSYNNNIYGYRYTSSMDNMSTVYSEMISDKFIYHRFAADNTSGSSDVFEGIRASGLYNTIVAFVKSDNPPDTIETNVLYVLKTPIETNLSVEDIEQYKKLHTNKPTTVVQSGVGAWMKIGYVADTQAYIDGKFKELQETIVNTQTQMLKGV